MYMHAHITMDTQLNGQNISWQHLVTLHTVKLVTGVASQGLPKLSMEYIKLTSFSRMRVHLATQVG